MIDTPSGIHRISINEPDSPVRIQSVRQSGTEMTIELLGEIRQDSSANLREWILQHYDQGRPASIILDFRGILFVDSQGLAVLFALSKALCEHDCRLGIQHACPHICSLFELTRLVDFIQLIP
jgi:anti-anti-sigma factor